MYADSSGYFHGTTGFGGCQPCPDLLIILSKEGYRAIELVNPDKDTVTWNDNRRSYAGESKT